MSATLRLAASSFLIVSRADKGFDELTIGCIATGAASGVFMKRISIVLSDKWQLDGCSLAGHLGTVSLTKPCRQ
ncbi:hypothetical protein [Mesorhizobium sp. NFR06]|uniref:hypothetical protein n=1 Tax=Mesorhizobium sp. NFR06 TaxID=1566290 RepID=UPI00165FEFF0|nr:hypothetical protein [Mesorhizobium sp. NFR06]